MQSLSTPAACEDEQQLLQLWYGAVEDFSRIVAMLAGGDTGSPEHTRLIAQAETARLRFENAHTMWQLHCQHHGCGADRSLESSHSAV